MEGRLKFALAANVPNVGLTPSLAEPRALASNDKDKDKDKDLPSKPEDIADAAPAAVATPSAEGPAEGSAFDADSAPWPDASAEAAFLSEQGSDGAGAARTAAPAVAKIAAPEPPAGPLPSLDELVQRLPAETRDVLDELFRARFTTVKRIPPKALKEPAS